MKTEKPPAAIRTIEILGALIALLTCAIVVVEVYQNPSPTAFIVGVIVVLFTAFWWEIRPSNF